MGEDYSLARQVQPAESPPVKQEGCPFYGFFLSPEMKVMHAQHGNQCALKISSYSPCQMEIAGDAPFFGACPLSGLPRVKEILRLMCDSGVKVFPQGLEGVVSQDGADFSEWIARFRGVSLIYGPGGI